jgi:dihydroxyacetone kinase
VEGQADIGKVYRLQAVADDVAAAKRLCDALQSDGVACQVKR